ncbi:hypothetical protein LI071_15280 [Bacillus subtilis]|uniref:hypothetical protein n=1 Tax=Bacillus subtilis TaxID=1423 RepID=UPI001D07E679|nr:hypothetical protein [Bacillus subtilis]MCB7162034.1 hypothetical protein [Bacillus subtilis]MCB7460278.1 hypothetical protein [Bacillus subtilis]
MLGIKKYIGIYGVSSLTIILLINLLGIKEAHNINLNELGFTDVWTIFANNISFVGLGFLLSGVGLSLILILKIFMIIGEGPLQVGINPFVYYFASVTHGLIELFVGCILFCFTVSQFKEFLNYMRGYSNFSSLKFFYYKTIKITLPVTSILIFIGAFLEVFVSKNVIKLFIS